MNQLDQCWIKIKIMFVAGGKDVDVNDSLNLIQIDCVDSCLYLIHNLTVIVLEVAKSLCNIGYLYRT